MKDARLLEERLLAVLAGWLGMDAERDAKRTVHCAVVRPARRPVVRPVVLTIRPRYAQPGDELGAA